MPVVYPVVSLLVPCSATNDAENCPVLFGISIPLLLVCLTLAIERIGEISVTVLMISSTYSVGA